MPLPHRRWFQFQLSTWFVLVPILAWAMACWPLVRHSVRYEQLGSKAYAWKLQPFEEITYMTDQLEALQFPPPAPTRIRSISLNPRLLYPAIALAAFVGWKAAWALWSFVAGRKVEQV